MNGVFTAHVKGFSQDTKNLYLIVDYLPGGTLYRLLKEGP